MGGPSHVSLFNSSKVSELREENKRLVTEREHLRKVLADREDDIKLIRKQWLKEKKNEANKTESIIQGYIFIWVRYFGFKPINSMVRDLMRAL